MPTAETRALLDRIRPLLTDVPVREVSMFGAIAVMVNDAMAVAVHQDGSMLVRVDPAQDAQLVKSPNASRAQMGAGRSMGIGWIRIGAEASKDDQTLSDWVGLAVRNATGRSAER